MTTCQSEKYQSNCLRWPALVMALLVFSFHVFSQTLEIELQRKYTTDTLIQVNLNTVDSLVLQKDTVTSETRATWLWASSIETTDKINKSLGTILKGNLNTVFTMVPPIDGNFGYGTQAKFEEFIKKASENGISVHAWFPNGRRAGSGELDYRPSEEQEKQVLWVRAIMEKYGKYLDGVQLDIIRYIHGGDVNIDKKMDAVNSTVRKIREFLNTNYPKTKLTAAVYREVPSTLQMLRFLPAWDEDVPQWFRNWYFKHQNSFYKGQTYMYVPMFMKYQQDPITWIKDSLVDAVFPMQYTIYEEEWQSTADYYKSFILFVNRPVSCLGMGLGWVPKPDDDSHRGQDAVATVKMIKYGRRIGIHHYCIFILNNHEVDDSEIINTLTVDSDKNNNHAPFKTKVRSGLKK